MTKAEEATDDALLEAYRATRWMVWLGNGTVEIRIDRPAPVPPELLPAAIVTAYNPRSRPRPAAENCAEQDRLEAELRAAGAVLRPAMAHGTGADAGDWDEPGVLVSGTCLAHLVAIAERYGQNAIVWTERDSVARLIATRAGFAGAAPGDFL